MIKLFFLLLIISVEVHGACSTPVNPRKVVVFVDNNNSYPEAESAEKAACLRGETFVYLPEGAFTQLKKTVFYYSRRECSL